jgi:threonine dehydrogenase-like Zn-dependent dehydrogenase
VTVRGVKMTTDGIRLVGPSRDPAPGDVRVTVSSSGICGSDLHLASMGPSWSVLGHEFSGRLDDGTAVAVLPVVHCGACDRCLAGEDAQCRNALGAMYGVSLDGGLADEVWVHPSCATPLPDGVPLEHANLVEPLGVALHGLHRSGVASGMRVLVLGAGPVGLCTVTAARHLGAEVDVEAHRPNRVAAAERLGASRSVGTDYDVVLDAAGTQSSLDRATELVRPGGVVGVLGTFWSPVALGMAFQMKEVTLVPAFTYGHHHGVGEFAEATRILDGAPDLADTLVTHRFGLDDAAEAFRVAGDRDEDPIKVVVHP